MTKSLSFPALQEGQSKLAEEPDRWWWQAPTNIWGRIFSSIQEEED
ncbi:MAG: hypothetical protein R3B74_10415 [Nitrospirales bacterium]|nr:hypothetical protein [Nitrospirales bacterium]